MTVWGTHTGTAELPVRIEGYDGRPLVYGDGIVSFLLDVQSYYTLVQGIDFTNSGGDGLIVSGDRNTINSCQSYSQGGDGIEVTGDNNLITNCNFYLNTAAGINLSGGDSSLVYNNSAYDNGTYGFRLQNAPNSDLINNISWSIGTGEYSIGVDASSQGSLDSNWNDLYTTGNAYVGQWNGDRVTLTDWINASFRDQSSISEDPKFYKLAWWGNEGDIYDFHLISHFYENPPVIDHGDSGGNIPVTDYDYEDRWDDPLTPNHGAGPFDYYDIGSDEYVDTDHNLLLDYWEIEYFGHPGGGGGNQDDYDGDGLDNIDEYYYYTNPANQDTDFDRLSDGDEISYSVNPLNPDSDGDGLLDGDEVYVYTNAPYSLLTCDPADPDSDHDSYDGNFHDGSEVDYWDNQSWSSWSGDIDYGGGDGLVNLLDPDSDGDGCPDGWEYYYGLDPADYGQFNIQSGGVGDPDGDRLNNAEEYLFGTSPIDGNSPTTRYVDASAPGGGDGSSWATAWDTIQDALDWKETTDAPVIVLVTSGVYYEYNLELTRPGIALMGADPYQRPIIDANFQGRVFSAFDIQTAKIDSFVIRNASYAGSGAGFYLFNSSPILSNLMIYNNTATVAGLGRGGAIYVTGSEGDPLIIGCTITENTGYNNYGGIYVTSAAEPRITDCIIWNNGDDLRGVELDMLHNSNVEDGDWNWFNGNISVNPRFYHAYSRYFHLSTFTGETNPNINAGSSWQAMLIDYEGEARWNYLSMPVTGTGIDGYYYYDIGADEYVDKDYNTLPDWWEMKYFGSSTGWSPNTDEEPDGLINYLEYYYLTDPLNVDTDFDGLTDSDEVTYWNTTHDTDWPDNPDNPHRWDSDDNGDRIVNIIDWDSEWDRLSDGAEVHYYGSDPAALDTDDDGMDDGDEVDYWNGQHNTDFPVSAVTTWDYDWDGDGIPNLLDPDSDGDRTSDGWEFDNFLDPADDGFYFLVNGGGGDPDNDRVNNFLEYEFGTDPNLAWSPQTVVVDQAGFGDYTSITAALADFNPAVDGSRSIIVRPGIYYESDISMKQNVALLGEYAYSTIIDAAGGRGLMFSGISAALLDGFTIRNASYDGPGGAILSFSSSPFISNCVIMDNTTTGTSGHGAALYAMNSSSPIVVNCTIAANSGTDSRGGIALDSEADDSILLINNIIWNNGDDLFGVQTDMAYYNDIQDGDFDGYNGNINLIPQFTNPAAGNYHIGWQSPMLCAGDYHFAGGYDMDGESRPQLSCPGPGPHTDQNSFNIGAHEAKYEPTPTPSVTPTPTPTITPTPSVTPTATPTPEIPDPSPPPGMPTRTPTPVGYKTVTPTPVPTATPVGFKTPIPTPTRIDFRYRDPIHNAWLYLWISNAPDPNTYYSIGFANASWQDIYDKPDNNWYAAEWTYGSSPGETWFSAWTYHGTETTYLEALWTTPTPTPTVTPSTTPDTSPTPSPTPTTTMTPTPTTTMTPTPTTTMTPTPTITPLYSPTPSVTATPTPTPTPSYANWYLAAGGTMINGFDFDEFVSITNPTNDDAYVEITAVDELGPIIRQNDVISPESRYTISLDDMVVGTRGENNDSVSLLIYDLTDRIIMVDRSMYWNAGGVKWGGGHNSVASNDRNVSWYLPEGATHRFDEYIHIVNPDSYFPADVKVTFMNMTSQTWTVQSIINPESNWTIHANEHVTVPGSIATYVESLPTSIFNSTINMWSYDTDAWPTEGRIPVVADRTMYWDSFWNDDTDIKWIDGHASKGTTHQSTKWYIAEGATHAFDCFILIMNPSMTETAEVKVTFFPAQAKEQEELYTIPPHTRETIWVNYVMNYVGSFSAEVESLNGVFLMVERALYWTAGGIDWAGGHDSIGAISLAPIWYLPEGATDIFDEYILLGNPDPVRDANVKVTFYFETRPPEELTITVPAKKRQTIYLNNYHITGAISTRLEETSVPFENKLPIVAERAMYWDPPPPDGVPWGGGHDTIGIPVWTEGK